MRLLPLLFAACTVIASVAPMRAADSELLVASYDVAREVYKDLNAAFVAEHPGLVIQMSHGGSSKQARAVIDGLNADAVAMNQSLDVDQIAKAGLLPKDWATRKPLNSSPSWSVIQFLVRPGNPKGIKDWGDLVKPGIAVILPNPKTSGNGRYSYLAAWGWAMRQPGGSPASAEQFVGQLFAQVPVLDAGGRGATTTFAQREIGDVLLTFENELHLIRKELADQKYEVVVPSVSIRADNPVSVVDRTAAKKGNADLANAYIDFHFTAQAQEIFAKNGLRPADPAILAKHAAEFPDSTLVSVELNFAGWANAQATHFADGGIYDRIVKANAKK